MSRSKKQQAHEMILNALVGESLTEIASTIVDAIELMTAKSKRGEKTDGAKVWEAYEAAVTEKYKFKPKRNAITNNQASQLAGRLGTDDAIAVVRFYVAQTDSWYLRNMHPIGLCLKDAEALYGKMSTGKVITRKAADKIESAGATLAASSTYLNRKYAAPEDKA